MVGRSLIRRMVWRGKQAEVMRCQAREMDVEGAVRSGKTTVCLWKEFKFANEFPGINILLCRWSDENTFGQLKPLWDEICYAAGVEQTWNARESCYDWLNGSRIYVRGLMTSQEKQKYSKFRGLTLARVYGDQGEEIDEDVYRELAIRLSQLGFPHQITISPQSVDEGHWINDVFPVEGGDPKRQYFSLSTYDNEHNLPAEYIDDLTRQFPADHPKHRTMVLGLRGMNVTGVPVYAGAFSRELHQRPVTYDPLLPVEVGIDFGKKHPCIVARQVSALGQVRMLCGIMGQDLYLHDFVPMVTKRLGAWFPDADVRWAGDPAGSADTSQGTKGAGKILKNDFGIVVKFSKHANTPTARLGSIEQLAGLMRRRLSDGSEGFVVNSAKDRWIRISKRGPVQDRFLAAALEAGYVWDKHTISVNNKQVKRPKKDGWYEHGCNCAEYLGITFDLEFKRAGDVPPLEGVKLYDESAMAGVEAWWVNA